MEKNNNCLEGWGYNRVIVQINYRRLISRIILVISAVVMIWSLIPGRNGVERRVLDESTMSPGMQEEGEMPAVIEKREVWLEWPKTLRIGGKRTIRLEFRPSIEGDAQELIEAGFVDAYDSFNIMAEARIEVAGVRVEPGNPTRESMLPGQALKFRWDITADNTGEYNGRVWLSLRFLPLDGDPAVQVPVYVREVRMDATSILGMSGETSRLVSGVGLLAGGVILIDDMIRSKKEIGDKEEEGIPKKYDVCEL